METTDIFVVFTADGLAHLSHNSPTSRGPDDSHYARLRMPRDKAPALPDQPVPQAEYQQWLQAIGPILTGFKMHRDLDELLKPEPVPPAGAKVSVRPGATDDVPFTLAVEVTNEGPDTIPAVSVFFQAMYETPQPDGLAVAFGAPSAAKAIGSGAALYHPHGAPDLPPGGREAFGLHPNLLPGVLGQVAGLSPERYWLSVRCGKHELHRVPGRELGPLLNWLEAHTPTNLTPPRS